MFAKLTRCACVSPNTFVKLIWTRFLYFSSYFSQVKAKLCRKEFHKIGEIMIGKMQELNWRHYIQSVNVTNLTCSTMKLLDMEQVIFIKKILPVGYTSHFNPGFETGRKRRNEHKWKSIKFAFRVDINPFDFFNDLHAETKGL